MEVNTAKNSFLVITNTVLPYAPHNVAYLALPSGLTYHFRYREKYFGDSTGKSASEFINSLQNKLGLLVLRDFNNATFIPLRKIKFQKVEHQGEFVFIDLEFLNQVVYNIPKTAMSGHIDAPVISIPTGREIREQYSEGIKKLLPNNVKNIPNQHMSDLIIPVADSIFDDVKLDDEVDDSETLHNWYNTISLLSVLPAFEGVSFYRLKSPVELGKGKVTHPELLTKGQKGYILTSDKTYELKVLQAFGSEVTKGSLPFDMKILTNESHISVVRNLERVDGIYDGIDFYFHTLPQASPNVTSYLFFESQQSIGFNSDSNAWPEGTFDTVDEEVKISIPTNRIPIEIRWSRWVYFWRRGLPVIAFILAMIVWFFSERWASLKIFTDLNMNGETFRYISIFLLAFAFQNWSTFTGQFKAKAEASQ